jgi:hypothetical protein
VPGLLITGPRQQHDELVTAVAQDLVADPQLLLQRRRHPSQHFVTDNVGEPVVDPLEVVDIDQHQRHRQGAEPQHAPQFLVQCPPVTDAGEGIGAALRTQRLVFQSLPGGVGHQIHPLPPQPHQQPCQSVQHRDDVSARLRLQPQSLLCPGHLQDEVRQGPDVLGGGLVQAAGRGDGAEKCMGVHGSQSHYLALHRGQVPRVGEGIPAEQAEGLRGASPIGGGQRTDPAGGAVQPVRDALGR